MASDGCRLNDPAPLFAGLRLVLEGLRAPEVDLLLEALAAAAWLKVPRPLVGTTAPQALSLLELRSTPFGIEVAVLLGPVNAVKRDDAKLLALNLLLGGLFGCPGLGDLPLCSCPAPVACCPPAPLLELERFCALFVL